MSSWPRDPGFEDVVTVTDLALDEQIRHVAEIAEQRGWPFERLGEVRFSICLPARDGTDYCVLVECDRFLDQPPAFHWFNTGTTQRDQPADTPTGGGYFHSSGRICAPWNRLAYAQVDPKGPHSDWQLANWQTNASTGGTTTLAAMILRIYTELFGPNYRGRMN